MAAGFGGAMNELIYWAFLAVEKRDILGPCLLRCVDLPQKAEELGAGWVFAHIFLDAEDGAVLELESCRLFV